MKTITTVGIAFAVCSIAMIAARRPLLFGADRILETCDNALESIRNRRVRSILVAALLLTPALVPMTIFGIYPLGYAIYLSVFDKFDRYIGFGNYIRAWDEPDFWRSLTVTTYYAACTIPLTMAISFLVALLLFRITRARGLFRTLYFLPYVTSVVAVATVWRVLLRPQTGFINTVFTWAGYAPQTWLNEQSGVLHLITGGAIPAGVGPSLALVCIIVFDIWHATGFMIVIFLAGLTAIPRELEEAAIIDGAGRWQVIRRIILPLLSPTIFFLTVVSGIKAFQSFNSFWVLMNAGHRRDTENLVVFIFTLLYENQDYGYGAAVAVIMCAGIVALTLLQWRALGRRVHYE